MNCLTEEVAMLYADGEAQTLDALSIEAHLAACSACRGLVAMLREENSALISVLERAVLDPAHDRRVATLGHLAGSVAASVAIAIPAQWVTALAGQVSVWVNYASSLPFEIIFRAWRAFATVALLILLTQGVGSAMTRRDSKSTLVIGSNETVADSLFATGESVLIEGRVEGNVFMFGRSLEIRGVVVGDVIAGGQEVRITGEVTGNVLAGAQSVAVSGHVHGNVYAGCQNLHVEKGGVVDMDVTAGSDTVTIDGTVGRGLNAGATSVVVEGTVTRGIAFAGNKVLVRGGGKVGGDIRAEVEDRNNVQVDAGGSVGGQTNVSVRERESQSSKPGTYIWQAAVLAGALLVGWLMMVAFPGFFGGAIQSVPSWGSVGIGFAALIVIPVASILMCVTLIGLPLGLATLSFYLAGLYLAKIFVAAYLGKEIIGVKREGGSPPVLGLLAGLIILQVLSFVPYGGGILGFGVVCVGLGVFILGVRRQLGIR